MSCKGETRVAGKVPDGGAGFPLGVAHKGYFCFVLFFPEGGQIQGSRDLTSFHLRGGVVQGLREWATWSPNTAKPDSTLSSRMASFFIA